MRSKVVVDWIGGVGHTDAIIEETWLARSVLCNGAVVPDDAVQGKARGVHHGPRGITGEWPLLHRRGHRKLLREVVVQHLERDRRQSQ